MKQFFLAIFFISILQTSFAKEVYDFSKEETALIKLYSKISRNATDEENDKYNKQFLKLLDSVLSIPETFFYAFDNLPFGNTISPDEELRVFSWNIINTTGTYKHYGFLQLNPKGSNGFALYELIDSKEKIKSPATKMLTPANWYGASYYEVLQEKRKGQPVYTLLGWNPSSLYIQEKVIEVLYFKKGKPQFGMPLIEVKGKGTVRRRIFKYSTKQSMMLRWEKRKKMIVFDHLSPSDIRYAGIYEFYGPDFSVDGYKFKSGKWRYYNDVDVRNPRSGFKEYLPFQSLRNSVRAKRQVRQ